MSTFAGYGNKKFNIGLSNESVITITASGANDLVDLLTLISNAEDGFLSVTAHVGDVSTRALVRADDIVWVLEAL